MLSKFRRLFRPSLSTRSYSQKHGSYQSDNTLVLFSSNSGSSNFKYLIPASFMIFWLSSQNQTYKNHASNNEDLTLRIEEDLKDLIARKGEKCKEVADSYYGLGYSYFNVGNYSKAFEYYEKALQIMSNVEGKKSENYGFMTCNMGVDFIIGNYFDRAVDIFSDCLDFKKKKFGEKSFETAQGYSDVAGALIGKKEYEKALEYTKQAYETIREVEGDRSETALAYKFEMGMIYLRTGQIKNGKRNLNEVKNELRLRYNNDHPLIGVIDEELNKAQQ